MQGGYNELVTRQRPEFQFDLSGGQLALDFANTVSWRGSAQRRQERLESYSDIIAFARQSGLLSPKQTAELRAYAEQHESETRTAYRKAIILREAIFRVFDAAAHNDAGSAADLKLISECALEAQRRRCLTPANGLYRWEWQANGKPALERIAWAASQAAADLLTSSELRQVRACEASDCEWLFLDHSRNRSRRWCDMKICGNRQKAKRHYRKTHE